MLSALWGGSFSLLRIGALDFGPVPLTFVRVASGAAFLLPFLLLRRAQLPSGRVIAITALVGVLNSAVPFTLFAQAALSMTAGLITVTNSTTLMFTALIALLWLNEPFARNQWFGFALGVIGLVVLFWGRLSFTSGGYGWAVLLSLGATFSKAVAITTSRRFLSRADPMQLSFISLCASLLCLLPLAFALWPQSEIAASDWTVPLFLGVFCTGFAFILYFDLIKHIGSSKTASVTLLIPFFGVSWGVLLLGEAISLRLLAGGLCIVVGTAMINELLRKLPVFASKREPGV